jgi:DNA-binding MarR family transcriptional regulator
MNKRVTVTVELPRGEKERSGERMTQLGKTVRACRAYLELQLTADRMQEELRERMEYFDLKPLEFRVMERLHHEGPQYQEQLAKMLSCGKRKIQHAVGMLERRGWVRRETAKLPKSEGNKKSEHGRAVKWLKLTKEGAKHIAYVFPKHAKVVKSYMKALDGREQETLARLCQKLREGDVLRFVKEMMLGDWPENLDWKPEKKEVASVEF